MATIHNIKWSFPLRTIVCITKLISYYRGGQSTGTHSYEPRSHTLHWTSKPPSYNLERPRVTPIQATLVTRPPAKHRLKTSIQSCVESFTQSNSAPETTWCLTHIARRKLVPNHLADTLRRQAPCTF